MFFLVFELYVWLGVSEIVLLIFMERRADFVRPRDSVESAVLVFLVDSLRSWRRRCETRGIGFKFSGKVIVRKRRGKEGA